MTLERDDDYKNSADLHDECQSYLYYHITLKMKDGNMFDGIIENVDADHITILVGEDVMGLENENKSNQQRQYQDRRPRRRFRRFRRQNLPINSLAALALLPYTYIAPPAYPYYPYDPYYPYY